MWDVEPYTLDLSDVVRISDDLLTISAANPSLRIKRNAAGRRITGPMGQRKTAISKARFQAKTCFRGSSLI